jgi:hypothetical protein
MNIFRKRFNEFQKSPLWETRYSIFNLILAFFTVIALMGIDGTEAEGTTYFKLKMTITGGKGRFEGATGYFEAESYGYPGFSSDTTLVGEEGTITGEIFLP